MLKPPARKPAVKWRKCYNAMAAIIHGENVPFGITQILPLAGFPSGKARIRMRNYEFVKVFIKTEDELIGYYPKYSHGVWIPGYVIGKNKSTK